MFLYHVITRLERVHGYAKGKPRGDVDRVAHQIRLEVDRFTTFGRHSPSLHEAMRDFNERREIRSDVGWIESRHNHRSLTLPSFAIRRKKAADTHLGADLLQFGASAKAIGAIA